MGGSRQSTKQEQIVDSIVHSVRSLDKLTWSNYDNVVSCGDVLLEEADYLRYCVDSFISEIKRQIEDLERRK